MAWYAVYGRHDLPWRLTRDPYAVLVSEVMLQQTQVERVRPRYLRWLERWPDAPALAAEFPAEVIREWAGLGYNRRALNLHRAAVAVVERHLGIVPTDVAALEALPGIGRYTARAIASFAGAASPSVARALASAGMSGIHAALEPGTPVTVVLEQRAAPVETNIGRVLARAIGGVASPRDISPRRLELWAEESLPACGARDHNLALMDLGAMLCRPRTPGCEVCPLAPHCRWLAAGRPPGTARSAPEPPFEDTARYARGRIVALLREAPATYDALAAALPEGHRGKLGWYLEGLERDGLAVADVNYRWSLPYPVPRLTASEPI